MRRNNYILAHKGSFDTFSTDNSIQFNQRFNDGRMTNTTPNNPREIAGKDVIYCSSWQYVSLYPRGQAILGEREFRFLALQVA